MPTEVICKQKVLDVHDLQEVLEPFYLPDTVFFLRFLAGPTHIRCVAAEAAATSDGPQTIPPPPLEGKSRQYPEKIRRIVDDISQLTLLEISQLNTLLKVGQVISTVI